MTTKEIERILVMSDSTSRIKDFHNIITKNYLTDKQYWKFLYESYQDSDRINKQIDMDDLKEMFNSVRHLDTKWIMTKSEIRKYNELPEFVTIYRGCDQEEADWEDYGISWSIDKGVAEWFANRMGGVIVEMIVPKSDLKALLLARGESEVIWIME